jgi:uncharacterized membrane-anchored protein YitT (DUF2179 family)
MMEKNTYRWGNILRSIAGNLTFMVAGSVLCALAINGILIPHRFVSGGFLGLALIFYYLMPVLSVGVLYALFNIPLFLAGWFFVSRRFLIYSAVGMLLFSLATEFVHFPIPVTDKLLAAILAGLILGAGSGLILRSFGSAGGVDILAVILASRFSLRLGTTIILFNFLILAGAAFLFSLEEALYTLIYLYVSAQIVNLVVNGLSQRQAILIVSGAWERISGRILAEINRGCTLLEGQGAYSGIRQPTLYTVVTLTEIPLLKQIIREEDPKAFVVISETTEVMGHRIGNQPHW